MWNANKMIENVTSTLIYVLINNLFPDTKCLLQMWYVEPCISLWQWFFFVFILLDKENTNKIQATEIKFFRSISQQKKEKK